VRNEARNELKDITAKISDYKPICMDSLDEVDLEQVEALEKRYKELQAKLTEAEENFPKSNIVQFYYVRV